jgi:hypothetical protein
MLTGGTNQRKGQFELTLKLLGDVYLASRWVRANGMGTETSEPCRDVPRTAPELD